MAREQGAFLNVRSKSLIKSLQKISAESATQSRRIDIAAAARFLSLTTKGVPP
jgi:hypothetical protein